VEQLSAGEDLPPLGAGDPTPYDQASAERHSRQVADAEFPGETGQPVDSARATQDLVENRGDDSTVHGIRRTGVHRAQGQLTLDTAVGLVVDERQPAGR